MSTLSFGGLRVTPVYPLTEITSSWPENRGGALDELALLVPPNGTASAPFVMEGDPGLLGELSFRVSPARGPAGVLAPERFEVRHATNENTGLERPRADFDVLTPDNPGSGMAVSWLTVRPPPGQAHGLYEGMVEVTAGDVVLNLPFQVEVVGFVMPGPYEMFTHASLYQSPEGVAWHYGTPLWSNEHLEKMEASFRLMGRVGQKHLELYVLPEPYFGRTPNIPFRMEGNRPRPDFRFAERYLRRFLEMAGPPESVALIVWSPALPGKAGRGRLPATLPVAFVDGEGTFSEGELPMYGPPETRQLWHEVVHGARRMLDELGLADTTLSLGVGSDERPNVDTVRFFKDIAPDVGWYLLTHGRGDPQPRGEVMQIGEMTVTQYISPFGPFRDRGSERPALIGGWDNAFPQISSIRFGLLTPTQSLVNFRTAAEGSTEGPWRGFTGMGLDFWVVDVPGRGRASPLHAQGRGWPRMHTSNTRALAAPGPNGALATTRYEMLLEGIQEAEARITLERVLGDARLRARLPAGKAEEMEAFLHARVNARYRMMQQEIHGSDTTWAPPDAVYDNARMLFAHAALAQRILLQAGQHRLPQRDAGLRAQPLPPARTWTDVDGRPLRARLVRSDDHTVWLRLEDKRVVPVPLERLSPGDRAHVEALP